MTKQNDIHRFWEWFESNSKDLAVENHPNSKISQLDREIVNIGLSWEIGPGLIKTNSLTISASCNIELLGQAREFISQAPVITDWEFYYFKQPKENWSRIKMLDYGIELTADAWTYTLLKYEDGKKEILIKGDNLCGIAPEIQIEIIEIVLINLLGEERMMNELEYIDVLDQDSDTNKMNKIQDLSEHLKYLKKGA